jgi:hypothetical protein
VATKHVRLTVEVDGEQIPYTEADWVIFDEKNFPVGFMTVEWSDLSADGARPYVGTRTPMAWRAVKRFAAFGSWEEGYSIKLYRRGPELDALLDQHLGKVPVGQERLPEDKE